MPDFSDQPGRDATIGAPGESRRHLLRIRRILERKIVPSLALDPAQIIPTGTGGNNHEGQADALVAMALQGRIDQAKSELRALHEAGTPYEHLQLGLLATAAERLGALWETDNLSFVDVTIATGTLQRLMHFIAIDLDKGPLLAGRTRSILIFPEPGAEHTFGAATAARFFERAGWDVHYVPDSDRATLRDIVRNRPVDVLGVSLSRADHAPRAGALVAELRAASRNPDLAAIAGGSAVVRQPSLITELNVDAALAAIRTAPLQADEMVSGRQR
ncbi:cobalamin B12-binding domain-containing protein [Oceanibium sediminis]|uniref:cobalamin B12-binding domain-containing protein n=1 Tax=Oceanibium sediminis TaxID=2026339 RepID=UPI000DD3F946|nr:cobalamin B12-binding domain-containing protein [Oceanibium sediminis]